MDLKKHLLKAALLPDGASKIYDKAVVSVMKNGGCATVLIPGSEIHQLGILVEDEESDEYVLVIPPSKEESFYHSLTATMIQLRSMR